MRIIEVGLIAGICLLAFLPKSALTDVDRSLIATMDAAALKAGTVAYLDFKDKIASERHVLPNVGAFLREEGNYFVRISKIAKAYEVAFIPRPTPEIPEFRGGGMEYIIDESSYEIRASARMK